MGGVIEGEGLGSQLELDLRDWKGLSTNGLSNRGGIDGYSPRIRGRIRFLAATDISPGIVIANTEEVSPWKSIL